MIARNISNRIPELDRLIDEKLTEIAACMGRERDMGDFDALSEDEKDILLNDAFDAVSELEQDFTTTKRLSRSAELDGLLNEHHKLTQEMRALHREIDQLDLGSN